MGMKVADLQLHCLLDGDLSVGTATSRVVAVQQVQANALRITHKAHLRISKRTPEPAHELIVLAKADMRERELQRDLPEVGIGEAEAVHDALVAPSPVHGVGVADPAGLGVAIVPTAESQRLDVALLQAVDHRPRVARGVQIVVVKVYDVLPRGQVRAHISLEADGELRLILDVDDALAQAPRQVGNGRRREPLVRFDHDELRVWPILGLEAQAELLVELLPPLRGRDHDGRALL
mmetsp:Transcript_109750/g.342085  ORF Transcript_109750/g.342085 Transcript_109750/m.342085 type:complete len:235 (+) Transcript_109750:649-1353(+)